MESWLQMAPFLFFLHESFTLMNGQEVWESRGGLRNACLMPACCSFPFRTNATEA